jgi:hypothetical protein
VSRQAGADGQADGQADKGRRTRADRQELTDRSRRGTDREHASTFDVPDSLAPVPPVERVVPCFAAEPPQEGLPYGRWAERLTDELHAVWEALDADGEDLGEPGEIVWYPDRTWHGRRYVPATSITSAGYELFGYVRFVTGGDGSLKGTSEPIELVAHGDFTEETAERNPEWKLDVCDEVIGSWHGPSGAVAAMTLVWGRPLVGSGRIVTAELGRATVDQCELVEQRFTLIAPDDYRHDLLEIKLWGGKGQQLACESLYEPEEDGYDAAGVAGGGDGGEEGGGEAAGDPATGGTEGGGAGEGDGAGGSL